MAFVGQSPEVVPPSRLVWTDEEEQDGAVTTVTFEERNGRPHLTVHELYPSKAALAANHGAEEGMRAAYNPRSTALGIRQRLLLGASRMAAPT